MSPSNLDPEFGKAPTSSPSTSKVLPFADDEVIYPSLPTFHLPIEDTNTVTPNKQAHSERLAVTALVDLAHRPSPNIAKRRIQTPSLTRTVASPSHSTRMAQIFQDAQTSLQADSIACNSPSRQFSSNTKRTRIPRL